MVSILFLLLTTINCQYRYINNQTIKLGNPNTEIIISSTDFLVYQANNNTQIGIYSLANNSNTQIFKSSNTISSIGFSTSNKQLYFISNDSIYQIQNQPQKQPYPTILKSSKTKSFIGATFGSSLFLCGISTDGSQSSFTYISYIGDRVSSTSYSTYTYFGVIIAGGSDIVTNPSNRKYFVSGAKRYSNQNYQFNVFRVLSSSIKFIGNIVFRGLLPQADDQKWGLAVSDVYNGDSQLLAITHRTTSQMNTSIHTVSTFRMNLSDQKIISQIKSFRIKGLIGANYMQNSLYTMDTSLCRILTHNTSLYSTSQFYRNEDIKGSIVGYAVSQDQTFSLLLTLLTDRSQAYLYNSNRTDGYQTFKTIVYFDYNLIAKKAYILNTVTNLLPNLLFFCTNGKIYILKAGSSSLYETVYDDICINSDQIMFAVINKDNAAILYVYQVSNGMYQKTQYDIPFVVDSILCLAQSSVLITPSEIGKDITILKYDNQTNAILLISKKSKLPLIHSIAYKTTNGFFFTHEDNHTIPTFYDSLFNQIIIKDQLILANDNVYQIVSSNTNDIFIAVGSNINQLDLLDYYSLLDNSLVYQGSFPLNQNGYAGLTNIVIFKNKRLVKINYIKPSVTVIYQFSSPPVKIQTVFINNNTLSCNHYTQSIFHFNPESNNRQYIVMGSSQNGSLIEKYSFSNNSLILNDQIFIKEYPPQFLQFKLSDNKKLLIISALRKNNQPTIYNALQMRNYNNLSQIMAFKKYTHLSLNNTIHDHAISSDSIFTIYSQQQNYVQLYIQKQIISNSAIQITNLIQAKLGKIAQFTICKQIINDFPSSLAVLSIDLLTINILNLKSGNIEKTIISDCTVQKLSFTGMGDPLFDWLLSYRCFDQNLYVVSNNGSVFLQGAYDLTFPFQLVCDITVDCYILINKNGQTSSIPVSYLPKNVTEQKVNKTVQDVIVSDQIVYDSYQRVYAYHKSPSTVVFMNLKNQLINSFTINHQNQTILKIFWQQAGKFAILTNSSNLIFLRNSQCFKYSHLINGYCKCQSSFIQFQDRCACPQFQIVDDNKCSCIQGKYKIGFSKCEDCSWTCSTCSQDGILSCDSFDISFISLCCVIGVLIIIGVWLIIRRVIKKRKQRTILTTSSPFLSEKNIQENVKE